MTLEATLLIFCMLASRTAMVEEQYYLPAIRNALAIIPTTAQICKALKLCS